jgi:hypothetical protein
VCALQVDDQLLQQEFAHADGKANRDPRKPHDNKDNKGKVDLDLAYLGFVAAATAPPPLVPRNDVRPTLTRSTTDHFADCLDELKDLFKEKGRKNSTCKHCVALANHLALKDARINSLQDELAATTVTLDKLTRNYSVLTDLVDRTTRAKASHVTAIEQCADRLDADLKANLTRVFRSVTQDLCLTLTNVTAGAVAAVKSTLADVPGQTEETRAHSPLPTEKKTRK